VRRLEDQLDRLAGNTADVRTGYRFAMPSELDFFSDTFQGDS
jgi:hypothetical protein